MRTFWISLCALFLACSCSVTPWKTAKTSTVPSCACEDGSWKYGPRWEKCGETVKKKIGKQGYYGELEMAKSTAYYLKDCRNSP